jgi:hypothetical protein
LKRDDRRRKFVKSIGLLMATLAFLLGGLARCSFGPDEYTGPWPPDAATEEDASEEGGPADDGGGSVEDGGSTDDAG